MSGSARAVASWQSSCHAFIPLTLQKKKQQANHRQVCIRSFTGREQILAVRSYCSQGENSARDKSLFHIIRDQCSLPRGPSPFFIMVENSWYPYFHNDLCLWEGKNNERATDKSLFIFNVPHLLVMKNNGVHCETFSLNWRLIFYMYILILVSPPSTPPGSSPPSFPSGSTPFLF